MKIQNKAPDYLTSEEVAKMFNVTERTILTWRRVGYLPYFKVGKTVRFTKADIDNALNKLKHG